MDRSNSKRMQLNLNWNVRAYNHSVQLIRLLYNIRRYPQIVPFAKDQVKNTAA